MISRITAVKKALKGILEAAKLLVLLGFLALLMFWLSGAFRVKVEPGPGIRPVPSEGLDTRPVELRRFSLYMEQVGTIKTEYEARISSRLMAQVVEVLVQEGEDVKGPGGEKMEPTLLARLDDRDIQARLRQALSRQSALDRAVDAARAQLGAVRAEREAAEANRVQAESNYRRYQDLHENRAATGQQLEQVKAQWEVAEANVRAAVQGVVAVQAEITRLEAQKQEVEAGVREAQVMLSHTRILAPFSGRVARKFVEEGDTVVPGQALFLLETPSLPEMEAVVSESLLPYLDAGKKYDVIVDALHRMFQGTVREVVPRADPATRTITVKVALPPESDLMSGLFGRLRIVTGEYEALVVPVEAVKTVGQLHLVQVVEEDGITRRRFVTLGHRHDDVVEVLSGLKEMDAVVMP